jgi:hypothetical protein
VLDKFLVSPFAKPGDGRTECVIAEYGGELSHLGMCAMERTARYINFQLYPALEETMELELFGKLHIQRKASALAGIPAKPTRRCSPKPWLEDSIEQLVQFLDLNPVVIMPENISRVRSMAVPGLFSSVPSELVGTCSIT